MTDDVALNPIAFALNPGQQRAMSVLTSDAEHIMLFGGSRSGKTFLLVKSIVTRALKAPRSRHVILRFRFNAVIASVALDTLPAVMRKCFHGVEYHLNKSLWYATLPNGSEIWFGGLDDKERTEKILGQEYVTIYLNESSQIPWTSVGMAITRLAQQVEQIIDGKPAGKLTPRMYYDCNPPSKAHWAYKIFVQHQDPDTKLPIKNPHKYASCKVNPGDNTVNLAAGYLETLQGLSARLRKRFLDGEFGDINPNGLFEDATIDKWRVTDGTMPDMVRIVVGVDPSGADDEDNADNDAIGIVVGGLGTDGNAYLLEDCTVKAGPFTWGKIATDAYERHAGDVIVGEINFGGAMVKHVIKTASPRANYKTVTSSRGKILRAEPFSALYEQGKVRHVGDFAELEDELTAFSTHGYLGPNSPNRADAWVFVLAELFPAIVKEPNKPREALPKRAPSSGGWMA